jgi:hypothetical protein
LAGGCVVAGATGGAAGGVDSDDAQAALSNSPDDSDKAVSRLVIQSDLADLIGFLVLIPASRRQ